MSGFDSSDDEREYDTSPFKIDWLDLSKHGCIEPLGISGLPATIVESDVRDIFVLCTKGELQKYRVPHLLQEMSEVGFTVHSYPFPDGTTPSLSTLTRIMESIRINLVQGRKCLIHCFGGLGRSCLVAVCLLLILDSTVDVDEAIATLRQLRGPGAVQSVKQYNFINEFRAALEEFEKEQEEFNRSVSR